MESRGRVGRIFHLVWRGERLGGTQAHRPTPPSCGIARELQTRIQGQRFIYSSFQIHIRKTAHTLSTNTHKSWDGLSRSVCSAAARQITEHSAPLPPFCTHKAVITESNMCGERERETEGTMKG